MSFTFVSCQQYEHGYFTAYRRLAEEYLDLVVHLGDYIYEYASNEYRAPGGNVRVHEGGEITTLAAYRRRHAHYRSDRDLRAAHAAFPFVITWDDHEVENNYANEIPESGQSPTAFLQRRASAYQAYYENVPRRRRSEPEGPDTLLYRRLPYGDLAEFNLLDTRQYRDDQAADDGNDPPNPEQQDPARTLSPARRRSGGSWTASPPLGRPGTCSPSRSSSPIGTSRSGPDSGSAWTPGTVTSAPAIASRTLSWSATCPTRWS